MLSPGDARRYLRVAQYLCARLHQKKTNFLRLLGPQRSRRKVEIFFGTLERDNEALLEAVLADPDAGPTIKGVQERPTDLTIGEHKISGSMAADSFSTIVLHHNI